MKNYKPLLITMGAFILLIILFALPHILNPQATPDYGPWAAAGISCVNEALQLAQHFHPNLAIMVDGKAEEVPPNTGITPTCAAEIHVHPYASDNPPGTLHIETPFASKTFYLKQFFAVWGKTIERPGYTVTMTVDGKPNTDLGELILKDQERIVLTYTKQT
jgi:hypothetical protein